MDTLHVSHLKTEKKVNTYKQILKKNMAVKTWFYFYWILEFFALMLHSAVTSFIILQRYRKNKTYMSPFYLLYVFISFFEMINLINSNLLNRFTYFDSLRPWFTTHTLYVTICFQISGFCLFGQAIYHASIAVNRAWVSLFLMKAGTTVVGKFGNYLIWILPIFPIIFIAPGFGVGTMSYINVGPDEIFAIYYVTWINEYYAIVGPTIVLSCSCFSFFLTIFTILRYRKLLKQVSGNGTTVKREIYLMIHATVTLFFEILVGCYFAAVIVSNTYNLPNLQLFAAKLVDYIFDISCMINPVALLIICKFVRDDFHEFVFKLFGRDITTKVVNISTSSNHLSNPQ